MDLSQFGKLNFTDLGKGFIMAVLGGVVTYVYQFLTTAVTALQAGQVPPLPTFQSLLTAGLVALGTGVAYLLKNIFTNSQGQTFTSEKK